MKAPSEAFERAPVKEDNMKSTMSYCSSNALEYLCTYPPALSIPGGEIAGLGMTSTDEFHAYQARPAQQEDPNQQRQRPFIQ